MDNRYEGTSLALESYLRDSIRASTKGMSHLDDFLAPPPADGDGSFSRVMLTISGVGMRLSVVLHHPLQQNGINLFSYLKSLSNLPGEEEAAAFYREVANQTCGEVKRYLHSQFQYLGMSTPIGLSVTTFLSELNGTGCVASAHAFLARDGKPVLGVSAYLHSATQLVLQYDQASTAEMSNSGELEFF